MKKRTEARLDFDYAKHGWAFCNRDMLEGKVERLRKLAACLSSDDPRHAVLETIVAHLAEGAWTMRGVAPIEVAPWTGWGKQVHRTQAHVDRPGASYCWCHANPDFPTASWILESRTHHEADQRG
jgi:hypothetical protein